MNLSPFERDIAEQDDALRAFADAPAPERLRAVLAQPYERIVLTGMGSSHFAAVPTWRRLVAAGLPAWWVDSGQLLDSRDLVTQGTLLVATSQSGASAEIAELLDPSTGVRPRALVAITNDPASPLAVRADAVLELRCGAEATVSTKSYLNTLAAHRQFADVLVGSDGEDLVTVAAAAVHRSSPRAVITELARGFVTDAAPRLAFVGGGDHAATALYAGLITKEAAKVAAEGYIGGQFRHGPLELAGPGLTAVLFGAHAGDIGDSTRRLASDLVDADSRVLVVGDTTVEGAHHVTVPSTDTLTELACGAVAAQHLAVAIARARGMEPGAFSFANKVTTTL